MSQNSEGFLMQLHDTIDGALDDVARNNFSNLESNSKRVAYLCSLPAIRNYELGAVVKCQEFPRKDVEKARRLKEGGNGAVQKGEWGKALKMYSDSMVKSYPSSFANRSAALNHVGLHEEALTDIRRCLALGYPRHLRYKVTERRARCLLVLKRNQEAIAAFQDTIVALDDAANLAKDKKQKMVADAKLMLEMLNRGLVLAGKPKDPEPTIKAPPHPKLTGKRNANYPAISDAVQIDYSESQGRYATATRDVKAGELLVVERPHSGVLLGEHSTTHCQHCLMKCAIPLACPNCPNVVFCSDNCLDVAQKSYHSYECHILPLIWKSGCSITCHLALRMMTQNNKEYFHNVAKDIDTKPTGVYKSDDYRNIYHLVSHEEERTKQDLLHRSEMTSFLVKLLELSGYFSGIPRKSPLEAEDIKTLGVDDIYKDDVAVIGGLILKNLQVLQFNAHEVFELQCPKPQVGENVIKHVGKSVFVAGAVFPSLALFNHSCDPSVVRYFSGRHVVVRAVKNIKKGEEVAENYGPIFTTVEKAKRLAQLKEQYWFECSCTPCQQNWPLIQCHIAVTVLDTDMLERLGKAAMEEGKYGEAMKKFIEVLKLYDTTLVPPYRSYYNCVQDLRRCMLAHGNYSLV
ncbi:hypothetical protein MSG28_000178 [Choristoneura fumiferana]|uniref:Uncharacterized protein n=1 Tax=Choristoneura fumiferana TaxID=7141 RepID=A0ACC0JZD8_CHOFU|nr:hypothetical protein MSG28_000178 [Choristoneura fumiferana]